MLYFKPENIDNSTVKFIALENNMVVGECFMKIEANTADVYELSYEKDKPYLVEGLLRSAFNSATLKGIYLGKCTCKNINEFLEKMNFEYKNSCYINDIPSILMGTCCK